MRVEMKASDVQVERIGSISMGIDGTDEYVRIRRRDDDLDLAETHEWLLSRHYRDSARPGDYFCTSVTIVPMPHFNDECIGIIHHRFDV